MASLDTGQGPISVEYVEHLILQLYQPGAPERIAETQETLQRLQRSPEGWQLADSLLGNKEESIRFFGALTYIVKLNTGSTSLSDIDAQALLQHLIGWLIRCLHNGEGALVLRKLCSSLVAYFLQFSTSWTRCVRHLLYCLCRDEAVPYDYMSQAADTPVLIENMAHDKAILTFWFAATLVEEVAKTDSSSMKQHKFHRRIVPNVTDIVPVIEKYISTASSLVPTDGKARQEAMACFQACVSYSHRAFVDDEIVLDPLRGLTKFAIMGLVNEDLYEISVDLISDVLGNYSKFLHKEDFTMLYSLFDSPWAQERYQRLVDGDFDFDSFQFGQFMIAFGDATVQDLAQKVDSDHQCHQFLSALAGLLTAEGYPVLEDKIFVPALEFWSTFVETMIDFTYSAEEESRPLWFQRAQVHVMQAINNCWRKIQFPPPAEFNSWDSADRVGFKDARRDVSDLLESFYVISGISILSSFIELAQQSIRSGNWVELEASLACIANFSDCIGEDPERDRYLERVFSPALFELFSRPINEIPSRALQAFLVLVRGYGSWFGEHTANLPKALNVAFSALESPALAKTASQMIIQVCGDCRATLVPQLGTFLQQFSNMSHSSLDAHVKEATIQSIASIIQAIPNEESQVAPLEQLLYFIELDIDQCLRLVSAGPAYNEGSPALPIHASDTSARYDKGAFVFGVMALRCLEGVAKGLQVPDDQPIDLERKSTGFWLTGNGSLNQGRIISMISRVYDALPNQGEVVEAACHVFRAGFVEQNGPFVFHPDVVSRFLSKAGLQTPRLGLVIGLACSLISSNRSGARIDEVINSLVKWLTQILQTLQDPRNDPEIAQNSIDFLGRLIPSYLDVLLTWQPPASTEFLFMFTFKALTGSDPLPKIAAADFWSAFLTASNQSSSSQDPVNNALLRLGPLLAEALIYNIGGNAARSELDKLSEPLRKLVVSQVQSKSWLEAALRGDAFDRDEVSVKDRLTFLQKLINLRGARGTNQVVRDFWIECRGTNFNYVS